MRAIKRGVTGPQEPDLLAKYNDLPPYLQHYIDQEVRDPEMKIEDYFDQFMTSGYLPERRNRMPKAGYVGDTEYFGSIPHTAYRTDAGNKAGLAELLLEIEKEAFSPRSTGSAVAGVPNPDAIDFMYRLMQDPNLKR